MLRSQLAQTATVLSRRNLSRSLALQNALHGERSSSPSTQSSLKPPSAPPTWKSQIRVYSEQNLIQLRHRADHWTDRVKTTFSSLGGYLNNVTGYNEVEALKRRVVGQEAKITHARQLAKEAKASYSTAVAERATLQRQLNDLLQRKHLWTDEDVANFTRLVRDDHMSTVAETNAKEEMDQAEETVEKEFTDLMGLILARYHEEQVWSDKIRSASTYGSLAVMALNLVVFISAIVIVEPWKRRRLAATFEKKVDEMEALMKAEMSQVTQVLEEQRNMLEKMAMPPTLPLQPLELPEDSAGERMTFVFAIPHHLDEIPPWVAKTATDHQQVAGTLALTVAMGLVYAIWQNFH